MLSSHMVQEVDFTEEDVLVRGPQWKKTEGSNYVTYQRVLKSFGEPSFTITHTHTHSRPCTYRKAKS